MTYCRVALIEVASCWCLANCTVRVFWRCWVNLFNIGLPNYLGGARGAEGRCCDSSGDVCFVFVSFLNLDPNAEQVLQLLDGFLSVACGLSRVVDVKRKAQGSCLTKTNAIMVSQKWLSRLAFRGVLLFWKLFVFHSCPYALLCGKVPKTKSKNSCLIRLRQRSSSCTFSNPIIVDPGKWNTSMTSPGSDKSSEAQVLDSHCTCPTA